MTYERKPVKMWHWIIVALLIVGAYAGTYGAIVRKNRLADPYGRPSNSPIYTDRSPMSSSLNADLSMFFWPAHWVDTWIRSKYWARDLGAHGES